VIEDSCIFAVSASAVAEPGSEVSLIKTIFSLALQQSFNVLLLVLVLSLDSKQHYYSTQRKCWEACGLTVTVVCCVCTKHTLADL